MQRKRRLIPFKLLPGSWGLRGSTYETAEAEYYYDGKDLELKLVEIRHKEDPRALEAEKIKIQAKYGEITDYESKKRLLELSTAPADQVTKEKLELEYEYHKITENEYKKGIATLNKEPWVTVVKFEINNENPTQAGEIELDWNEYFIEELKKNNYSGTTDYSIVYKWFDTLCSSIANETGLVVNPEDKKTASDKKKPGRKEYF